MTVPEGFAHWIPHKFSDVEAAPLLCAGAVGYRSLRLADPEKRRTLGLTGFGASGHLVLKMARYRFPDVKVFVFARSKGQRVFARELGASWAGDTSAAPPEPLDCIIDTTPAWTPVVEGLRHLAPGGRLVINAIGKEDGDKDRLLSLDYPTHLWMEKEIKSVANVTRKDVAECLSLAAEMEIRPEVQVFPLGGANRALMELRSRKIRGAKVLEIGSPG
jgi:propanol-preferring alcohol dehydrogenase